MARTQFNIKVGVKIDTAQADKALAKAVERLDKNAKDVKVNFKGDDKGIKSFGNEVTKTNKKVGLLTKAFSGLGQSFSSALVKFLNWTVVGGIVIGIANSLKEAVGVVIELDFALTNLSVVSGATASELEKVSDRASELADNLATSKKEIIDITTEFSRAGFSINESFTLAQQALIGANVGFLSVDQSAKFLIATIKAFNLEVSDAQRIVDNLFETSRTTAITFEGLGEALLRAGNSLEVAGASLEQTIALIASANESIQDPAKVGTALKTLSARIRGVSEEGDELGAKLAGLLEGVNVDVIDKTTGGFRNIFDILRDLSLVINDLDDLTKQNILEQLAGKRQINILIGLLNNFDTAVATVDNQLNAFGSSAQANEEVLDSITKSIERFKVAFDELAQSIISSDLIKLLIDGFTILLKVLTFTVDNFATLSVIVGAGAVGFLAYTGAVTSALTAIGTFTAGIITLKTTLLAVAPLAVAVGFALGGIIAITSKFVSESTSRDRALNVEKKSVEDLEVAYKALKKTIEEPTDISDVERKLKILRTLSEDYKKAVTELEKAKNADNNTTQEGVERIDDAIRAVKNAENALLNFGSSAESFESDLRLLGNTWVELGEEALESAREQAEAIALIADTILEIPPAIDTLIEGYEFLNNDQRRFVDNYLQEEKRRLLGVLNSIQSELDAYRALDDVKRFTLLKEEGLVTGTEADLFDQDALRRFEAVTKSLNEINSLIEDTSESFNKTEKSQKKAKTSTEKVTKALSDEEKALNAVNNEISIQNTILQRTEGVERIKTLQKLIALYGEQEKALRDLKAERIANAETEDEITEAIMETSLAIEQGFTAISGFSREITTIRENLINRISSALKEQNRKELEDFKELQQEKIDLINKEIEAKRSAFKAEDFADEEEKLNEEIKKLVDERAQRELEGSLESKARILEINEELKDKQEELDKLRTDEKRRLEIESLEKEKETLEEATKKQEDELEERLDNDRNYIEAKELLFLSGEEDIMNQIINLLATFDQDFVDDARTKGQLWVDEFKNQVKDISSSFGQGAKGFIPTDDPRVNELLARMTANSRAWFSASAEEKIRLHEENKDLAKQIASLTGTQPTYQNGKWDILRYKNGGLADFTGIAQLDGTRSKPESVLNPEDTAIFRNDLPDLLRALKDGVGSQQMGGASLVINEMIVNPSSDVEVQKIGANLVKGAQSQMNIGGIRING